ncbi:MAG: OPT/YSL family transporter [Limisphaerales bacterium]
MKQGTTTAVNPADDAEYKLPLAGFTGTPEEKDRQWFEQCYRGDSQRQLTIRAVFMGGFLGMFMAVSNLYTTLKIGWSFGVSITACVISFVVWNSICTLLGGRVSRMGILENNCMQSTATAAGSSTGTTLATALGALLLVTGVQQPWPVAAGFVLFTAALGVFLAIPMKRQMINHEQLRFPTRHRHGGNVAQPLLQKRRIVKAGVGIDLCAWDRSCRRHIA